MKKQILMLLLKYGLGLGLLAWVIYSYWDIKSPDGADVGLAGVLEIPMHWPYLLLAGVIGLASILLTFLRWYVLVLAPDLPFTISTPLRLGMIGYYLSTFLPGSVGGDIIKAAFVCEQNRRTLAVATVIIDRVIGLCGLTWLVALVGSYFWLSGILPQITATERSVAILESIFRCHGIDVGQFGLFGSSWDFFPRSVRIG